MCVCMCVSVYIVKYTSLKDAGNYNQILIYQLIKR